MSALEIVAIVMLCILGGTNILIWGQVTLLFDKVINDKRKKEKPSSETEADEINKKGDKK